MEGYLYGEVIKIAKNIKGITIKLGAETTGLGKALKDVNKKSRDVRSELRKIERLLKFNPKDTELLAQKQQLLSDRVANTSEKLNRLKSVQSQVNEQFKKGEINPQQYRDFQRELIKTNSKLKTFEQQLKDSSSSSIKLGKNLDKLGGKLKGIGDSLSMKVTAPVLGAFTALTEGTRDFRKELSILENNTKSAGANIDNMSKAMEQMQGVTGELDSNVEGLSNLLAAGFKGDKFQQVLDELSGAAIKFKDTLKFEGIADGLQETLATGNAVGQFGELLERSGIVLDDFNAGLQEAIANGEEQNYILQTLADTGLSQVYEQYRRNNKELVESAEANYRLKQSFADLGKDLEPIMTRIKETTAEVVNEFNELDEETKELIIKGAGAAATLGPIVVVLGQITTAASTLTIALGTLELAFAPFAIGATIAVGLAYIAKKFLEAREEAALLNKEVSKLSSIDEAGQRLEIIDKRISRTKKQMAGLTDEQGNLLNPADKDIYENWQKRLNELLDERTKTLAAIRGLELGAKVQAEAEERAKAERKVLDVLSEQTLAYRAGRLEKEKYKKTLQDIIADEKQSNEVVARAKSLLESLNGVKIETPEIEDDFEKEWQNKLALARKEGLEKELEQLRQQKEQALEIADEKEKDTTAIIDFYKLEEEKIRDKYNQKDLDALKTFSAQTLAELEKEKEEAIKTAMEKGLGVSEIEKAYAEKTTEIKKQNLKEKEVLEEEWSNKLFKQSATRLEKLDKEKEEAIKDAKERAKKAEMTEEELNEELLKIDKYYNKEKKKLEEQLTEKEQSEQDKRMKIRRKYGDVSLDEYKAYLQKRLKEEEKFSEDWIAIQKKIVELSKKENQEEADEQLKIWKDLTENLEGYFSDAFTSIIDGTKSATGAFEELWDNTLNSVARSISDKLAGSVTDSIVNSGIGSSIGSMLDGVGEAITGGLSSAGSAIAGFAMSNPITATIGAILIGGGVAGKLTEQDTAAASWNEKVKKLQDAYSKTTNNLFNEFGVKTKELSDLVDEELVHKKVSEGGWLHDDDWAWVKNLPAYSEAFKEQMKEITEKIMPKLESILENVQSGLNNAFSADSYASFLSSFGNSLKNTILNNLKEGFLESQAIQPLMKKLTGTIYEATKDQVLDDSERQAIKGLYDQISETAGDFYTGLQEIGNDLSIDLNAGNTSSSSGGSQISEITGGTRDLFTDLLTPLANFPSLVGINERIYSKLVEMKQLMSGGMSLAGAGGYNVSVRIENLNVESQSNSSQSIANASVSDIESAIATAIGDGKRGKGR